MLVDMQAHQVVDTMEFITIASTGNATDFGDLIAGTSRAAAGF